MGRKSRKLLILNELRALEFVRFACMNKKFCLFAVACLFAASQALAEDPRFVQGRIFESQGNFEMALGEYRAILAEQPKNAEAYLAAANVRVKMKDLSGALANFRLAYKFDPTMSAAYEGAAKIYEANGDKKKAAAERAKDPKNRPAEENEAAAEPSAEPVEAKPAPAPVEAPKPVEKVAEPAKVAEPVKVAEPAKVVEPVAAPKAAEAPADPFERGKALFAEGKYTEAAPLWREVLKKSPGHAGAYFYAGLTRFELGEYDKAEFNLKKGLEYKDEGNDANYYLACVYQKSNKTDLEKRFLNNYLKKAAPNAKFRRKAESRLAEMEIAKAEAAAKEAEAAKAVDAAKMAEPAEVKTADVKAGKSDLPAVYQPAKSDEPAVEASAGAPALTLAAAIEKFRDGNLEEALQSYKNLLDTKQNPEERYFTLLQMGNIYREMRDFHSAVTRYREVVQQFPDSDWATEAERALEDAVWLEKHASELPRRK